MEAFHLGDEAGRIGSTVCEQIIGVVVRGPPLPASVLLDLGFWLSGAIQPCSLLLVNNVHRRVQACFPWSLIAIPHSHQPCGELLTCLHLAGWTAVLAGKGNLAQGYTNVPG